MHRSLIWAHQENKIVKVMSNKAGIVKLFIGTFWLNRIQAVNPLGLTLENGFVPISPSDGTGDQVNTHKANLQRVAGEVTSHVVL